MRPFRTEEDKKRRPHLIEYDRESPSPLFSAEMIAWINSIQDGFSTAELAWLHENEYFILNTIVGDLIGHVVPGLRPQPSTETEYVRRYNSADCKAMMDEFLSYVPPGLTKEFLDYCNRPRYRVTMANGDRFYPVEYHNDLAAWRRQVSESAKLRGTITGRFEHGKFVLSNGQKINFSDLTVARLFDYESYPSDW